jgi:hypothetical protein
MQGFAGASPPFLTVRRHGNDRVQDGHTLRGYSEYRPPPGLKSPSHGRKSVETDWDVWYPDQIVTGLCGSRG